MDIAAVWDEVLPMLKPALDGGHGQTEARDVLDACLLGDMQLWFTGDAAAVTEIRIYPRTKVCWVILAGGNLESIKAHIDDVGEWAKDMGCVAMEAIGRKGWVRALGWDEVAVIARTEI